MVSPGEIAGGRRGIALRMASDDEPSLPKAQILWNFFLLPG
jgi:hypothetical protein